MVQSMLLILLIYNFLPLGSMQRKLGSFGGKAFHQVYEEQFGSWLLEMIYTLLMVSFFVLATLLLTYLTSEVTE